MTSQNDLALLRRFEPIIRYTHGEQFFPMDVADYVAYCSLWVHRPNRPPYCLRQAHEVTLETLANLDYNGYGSIYYLKFIEPLNVADLAARRLQQGLSYEGVRHGFRAGRGRLARVGYGSRLIDAAFSLSLLARGRVPGATAVAAELAYDFIQSKGAKYVYYGRIVRSHGWTALQYWYFYPFNNWRSGFFGVNDHEGDWEMVCVYLAEDSEGELHPEWIAYSTHDISGDNLRRRWDDPDLETIGNHPVVYASAGSHAGYFKPGEYLSEVQLPLLRPLARLYHWLQDRWRVVVGEVDEAEFEAAEQNFLSLLRVPFVDYARGDGLSIGPGQMYPWTSCLLDPIPGWVKHYRGLWGLFARDPISGENAPAGPMYNRDGTVRQAWYDPMGWSGIDKVPPPAQALAHVQAQGQEIVARCARMEEELRQLDQQLRSLFLEAAAMKNQPHLRRLYEQREARIAALAAEIDQQRAQLATDAVVLDTLARYAVALEAGQQPPPRSHLTRIPEPANLTEMEVGRLAEAWAAVSIGLAMLIFVVLVSFSSTFPFGGLTILVSIMVLAEAAFRRRFTSLIRAATLVLAFICACILIYEFFWEIVTVAVLLAGGYIMWENLRELWT